MYDHSNELILQDVRCFHGEQRGRVEPITLLVGENSTGKTTFLSCFNLLHQLYSERWFLDEQLDFNEEPFSMGAFRDIVSSKRELEANIDQFKLCLKILKNESQYFPPYYLVATFSELRAQPVVSSLLIQFNEELFLELKRSDKGDTIVVIPEKEVRVRIPFRASFLILRLMWAEREYRERTTLSREYQLVFDYLENVLDVLELPKSGNLSIIERWAPNLKKPIPIAPLRSKPKRTYDPVREIQSPEGRHIPMLMMRLDLTDRNGWTSLQDRLVKFGNESGMFSDIKVKRHGKQMSDPFQLQIEVRAGLPANIMDVGYGISQSLPILVDVLVSDQNLSMNHEEHYTFLMQQPEVHLHPRAQAELTSFFVESYKRSGNRFLIETHSDYIIDRFRIEVRTGNLEAKDVSILYFEPNDIGVTIHNISLDENGNLVGAPDSYRKFFMKETDRLLGFVD